MINTSDCGIVIKSSPRPTEASVPEPDPHVVLYSSIRNATFWADHWPLRQHEVQVTRDNRGRVTITFANDDLARTFWRHIAGACNGRDQAVIHELRAALAKATDDPYEPWKTFAGGAFSWARQVRRRLIGPLRPNGEPW